MLRVDPRNARAAELHAHLAERLDPDTLPLDLCLVVGGDGWMLSCIRELGPEFTFLGLNAGRVGFLLNDVGRGPTADDAALDKVADQIVHGKWVAYEFPRLAMETYPMDPNTTMRRDTAVNDVYVERMTGQTAHLRLHIDGVDVVKDLVCDGIVVATALGSTAYSFSAGGFASHPRVRAIHVTPIAPHMPRLAPLTLPEDSNIIIEVLSGDHRPVRAVCDGVDHGAIDRLHVHMAIRPVKLAYLEGHHFTGTLVRKILVG